MPHRLVLAPAAVLAAVSFMAVSATAGRSARIAQDEDCTESPVGDADRFTLVIHGDLIQDEEGGTDSGGTITQQPLDIDAALAGGAPLRVLGGHAGERRHHRAAGRRGRLVNRLIVRSENGGTHSDTAHVSACRRILPRQTG